MRERAMKMSTKFIYTLNECAMLNDAQYEVGADGEMLGEAIKANLPIADGFVITTNACTHYYENERSFSHEMRAQVFEYIDWLEQKLGQKMDFDQNPLLVAVRAKSRFSIPGLMDTVLYVGITDSIAETVATQSGDGRWIYSCYKMLIETYSAAVEGIPTERFKRITERFKADNGIVSDADLSVSDLKKLVGLYKQEYKNVTMHSFPTAGTTQLFNTIKAAFDSWDSLEANAYRKANDIPYAMGLAVAIQTMVCPIKNEECGAGTLYPRDPETGEKVLRGEYRSGPAQKIFDIREAGEMADRFPVVYRQLKDIAKKVDEHWLGTRKVDFAVQDNMVYVTKASYCNLSPVAMVMLACELVDQGVVSEQQAAYALTAKQIYELQTRRDLDEDFKVKFERVYGWAKAHDTHNFLERELTAAADVDKYNDVGVEFDPKDIDF